MGVSHITVDILFSQHFRTVWVCDMKVKAWEFLFLRPLPERI